MNIRKNSKNNTYYFSISLGIDPITQTRRQTTRRGFKTKKEAEKVYNRLKLEYLEGQIAAINLTISFTELTELSCKHRKTCVRINTYSSELKSIQKYILPYFQNADYKNITKKEIFDFQTHLKSKNLSNNSINKIMLYLKLIFDYAVTNNYLPSNPCLYVKSLRLEKKKMNFWLPEDFQKFIEQIRNDEEFIYEVFFTLAYFTGARLSELLGLEWNDINFNTGIWKIEKTVQYDKLNKQAYLDGTKTKNSQRSIALNGRLIQLLQTLQIQSKYKYVFAQNDLELPQRTIYQNKFLKNIKNSEVKKIRFHDLRHSHVALLISLGEDPYIIKERIGHGSISTTYDIYGHLFPSKQRELADKLDFIL